MKRSKSDPTQIQILLAEKEAKWKYQKIVEKALKKDIIMHCPICKKSVHEQISWAQCPLHREQGPICINHCLECEHIDQDNGHFRCMYLIRNKRKEDIKMNEDQKKELTYHFLKKNGIRYEDLVKIKNKEKEFGGVEITALSQYHVKLEHPDYFILCRFLDEMVAFEKSKRTKK